MGENEDYINLNDKIHTEENWDGLNDTIREPHVLNRSRSEELLSIHRSSNITTKKQYLQSTVF